MFTTLQDIARRLDPNGSTASIIEMMAQENEILRDMPFMECNDGTSHKSTIRTGLPSAFWRMYNRGVPKSKSTTTQITDHTAMMEARSEVDKDLVDINTTNAKEFRLSEDAAFLSAMNNQMAETVFYGDSNTPAAFVGLAPRFNKLSKDPKDSGSHIIDAGGTGDDLTSVWLLGLGPRTIHGIYPKGTVAGFKSEDKGVQTVLDADGNPYDAYSTKFTWKNGLCVRDWRYAVRIVNVSLGALASGTNAPDLNRLFVKALHMIPKNRIEVKLCFYCREEVFTALDLQTMDKKQATVHYKDIQGEDILHFRQHPIRQCDAIKADETRIQ